jgi:hypothetical protein
MCDAAVAAVHHAAVVHGHGVVGDPLATRSSLGNLNGS